MKRRIIFFDIDGTLTTHDGFDAYIPDSARKAIRLLQKNGHLTALASGRQYYTVRPFMADLGIPHAVTDGGNGLVKDHVFLGCEPMDPVFAKTLCGELDQKKIPYAIMTDPTVNVLYATPDMIRDRKELVFDLIPVQVVDDFDKADIYKIFMAVARGEEERIETLDLNFVNRWEDDNICIEPTDKTYGIRKLTELLGMKMEDAVIFGDGYNDIRMFEMIPFSIAMGNAVQELRDIAFYVTADAKDDGIWKACEHFGWLKGDENGTV